MNNPFRESLMLRHFESFRSIIEEINYIKEDLKKKRRRVNPPAGTYTAYHLVKQIALPLSRIFNSARYSLNRSLEMFTHALHKINLLIDELVFCGEDKDLLETFRHLYRRLFNMLPVGTVIQHQLFDAERYNNDSKKRTLIRGFLEWLEDYKYMGYQRRDIERRRAYKPIQIFTYPLRLSMR